MDATEPQPKEKTTERTLCELCSGLGEHKTDCTRHPDAKPEFVFPAVPPDDYGIHHLDTKTNILWMGLKLEPSVHNYQGAVACLHSMEHVIWQFYREVERQMRIRQTLAAGAAAGTIHKPAGK